MNLIRIFKNAYAAIKDPDRDFVERVFLILTFISEISVFIAFVGDMITQENPNEMIVIGATLIAVPTIVLVSLKHNRLKLAIRIIVIGLVSLILPGLFFFGGGVEGGGYIWIIFAFIYVGLVLSGRWRNIMFMLIAALTLACYLISYYYPETVYNHSREMFYVDTFISLLLVGVLCFVMTWSQGYLFRQENERAMKEAQRAEELSRSQNRFFSSMSHEIRTPINSILGLNELILRDQDATDDIVKDASGIQGSGKMLLALINDILDFSKIEAGSMDIVPVDYRIGDMLSEVVNMMWLRAHDKGLAFEVNVDPKVPTAFYGDEVRIKQIIINLLNNAVKYTSKGSVELRIECNDVEEGSAELCISVSDTGIGIRKEDLPYLFDAFKRVDEGKNRHIEGTGLGLSIVKQLVELMNGTISVNSVYGEGSTFTVQIRQGVADGSSIGELNIHNQNVVGRSTYESSFLAPEARILIVDDNEMNLEVESRLLEDTDMGIDKATNGRDALDMCQNVHYDAIFMDHLMPGMDGIECLKEMRNQAGGLNRNTPVIVLTANAGSENRELYNLAGFDGYLVKPVSGETMEDMLIRHISGDKIILRKMMMGNDGDIHTSDRYAEKLPVIITAPSMCDLPDSLIRKLNIPIIPSLIKTEEGVFKDGVHMDAYELIRHVTSGGEAVSYAQDEAAYTEFFAENLKKAHHLIHISITSSMSKDYERATEAARAFDNVSVVNSECLSSATGILVLIACKLVQQGMEAEDIVSELEVMKHRLKCSFIIDTTEYMTRKGHLSRNLNRIAEAVNLHPSIKIRNDKPAVGGVWFGRTKRAYSRYISRCIPADTIPDSDVVFVTYVDVPTDMLNWIGEEIKKVAYFEHVIFQQASASISSNCGPGTFGILYFLKSNKSYNIGSFLDDMNESATMPEAGETDERYDVVAPVSETDHGDDDPYKKIAGIDLDAALKNSGSREAFESVLRIFWESIPDRYDELEACYSSEDWENYTIKIHALKSSARLVGALDLGNCAELLETAGKKGDIGHIREKHGQVMEDYLKYMELLAPLFGDRPADNPADKPERPVIDDLLMNDIYEALREAAEAMDCDRIEEIMEEVGEYSVPESEKERFDTVRKKVSDLDYDGILEAIGNRIG